MGLKYDEEASKLAKAIDIAIEAAEKYVPEKEDKTTQEYFIKAYKMFKEDLLQSRKEYKNLTSLKYRITEVFTYFQEGRGETVEYFWKRLKEENLDYKRVNRLAQVLKRGKIRNDAEFDYVTDTLVPLQQEGTINEQEAERLSQMLYNYEFGSK
jgi:hypothetical protein